MDDRKNLPDHETLIRRVCATAQNQFAEFTEETLLYQQISPTTWIFSLRKDAQWSNGDGVTADDFVYGMRRLVDPKTASGYANTFGAFLLNGIAITEGKKVPTELGVKAIDKYTLEVRTPFPVGFLPELMANPSLGPVHKSTVEKFGREWTKPGKMVGNGGRCPARS